MRIRKSSRAGNGGRRSDRAEPLQSSFVRVDAVNPVLERDHFERVDRALDTLNELGHDRSTIPLG